jgi:hypothetical protein
VLSVSAGVKTPHLREIIYFGGNEFGIVFKEFSQI